VLYKILLTSIMAVMSLNAETPRLESKPTNAIKEVVKRTDLHVQKDMNPFEVSRFAPWSFKNKKNVEVTCTWLRGGKLESERAIFVAAFTQAYKHLRLEQLFTPQQVKAYAGAIVPEDGYKALSQEALDALQVHTSICLEKFLHEVFDDEVIDVNDVKKEIYTVSASINGKVVGFAACNPTEVPGQIYLRQLAVSPEYWRMGIGKKLLYSFFRVLPNTKHLILAVRRLNTCARDFYSALNFSECDYMYEKLVAEKYVGLQFIVPNTLYFDQDSMTFKQQPHMAWQQANK